MRYIIIDLEWNNGYSKEQHGFLNEIVEIGAIALDEQLEVIDTYTQLIKPSLVKKLSNRFINLTKITPEEVNENGVSFDEAIESFREWCGEEENVFLSWSNSDLYVLLKNFELHTGDVVVDFMDNYCDAQRFCMRVLQIPFGNQIGLANCAEMLEISVDTESLHRALADCYLTAKCLDSVFDDERLKKHIKVCDRAFFERLMFKPYLVTEAKCDVFDLDKVEIQCPICQSKMDKLAKHTTLNKSFCVPTHCKKCNKKFWSYVRAKVTYDGVEIYKHSVAMNKKRAKKIK